MAAQDEIVIKYDIELGDWKRAQEEIKKASDLTEELKAGTQAAFGSKAVEEGTKNLKSYNDQIEGILNNGKALNTQYKELVKVINSGNLGADELRRAKEEAAELKDRIGDTREELSKMASDTRRIDSIVDVAKGAAAAFSLAQGAVALFGAENKNLEKIIAKTTAAMAVLQGVQELGQQLTTKGTLLNKAYAASVGFIESGMVALRTASIATWGAITGGVALAIAGIVYLVTLLGESESATEKINEQYDASNKLLTDQKALLESIGASTREVQRQLLQNNLAKQQALLNAEIKKTPGLVDQMLTSFGLGSEVVKSNAETYSTLAKAVQDAEMELTKFNTAVSGDQAKIAQEDTMRRLSLMQDGMDKEIAIVQKSREYEKAEYVKRLDDALIFGDTRAKYLQDFEEETGSKIQAIRDKYAKLAEDARIKAFQTERAAWKAFQSQAEKDATDYVSRQQANQKQLLDETAKLITDTNAQIEKLPPLNIPLNLAPPKDIEAQVAMFINKFADTLTMAQPYVQGFANITSSLFETETNKLEEEKQKQLAIYGNDVKARERIEREYAVKKAVIARKQAEADKAFALFDIALKTAQAIQNAIANPGFPAAAPLIALIAAQGVTQAAAVASRPLPEIPKFEKSGPVPLVGGNIYQGMITGRRHSKGGVLIEAEGGEYISHRKAVAEYGPDIFKAANELRLEPFLMANYVLPALKAANNVAVSESYDDSGLKLVIRKSSEQSAKYMANTISKNIAESNYHQKRYRA